MLISDALLRTMCELLQFKARFYICNSPFQQQHKTIVLFMFLKTVPQDLKYMLKVNKYTNTIKISKNHARPFH